MRFPLDPIPPVGVTEDLYEIQEKSGITPVRPVNEFTPPPLPPRRGTTSAEPAPRPEVATEDRRLQEDRRKMDRRVLNPPVLIDTRSGLDRRKRNRRDDDPTTSIDEKA